MMLLNYQKHRKYPIVYYVLHLLMKAVLDEVKIRSAHAQKKFEELQKKQIIEAKERFKNRQFLNEQK